MKKYLNIFAIVILGLVSCNKLPFCPESGLITEPEEGATMILQFSIPSSPSTKGGMTDQPNITSASKVHVFVFNANSGALLQVSEATLKGTINANTSWNTAVSDIANTENYKYISDFVAEVNMGSSHRYLQVVVDAPTYTTDGSNDNETGVGFASNPIYLGDSETDVASKLYTTGGNTSFWQRIDLPNGLQAYTYPGGRPEKGVSGADWSYNGPHGTAEEDYYTDKGGNTVYFGDYVNGSGQKITDGTGYVMSTDVAGRVKFIPLVRNFVKIQVSKADDGNFIPSKAVLINVPSSGFVAPYSAASGFVPYYLRDKFFSNTDKTLSDLPSAGPSGIASTGYTAPVPNDVIDTSNPGEGKCVQADSDGVITLFMYERGKPASNPTQLLIYGSLNGTNKWLKMDITDEDGQYIALYRDLTYEMKIGVITGTTGHDSIDGAYTGPAIGNPSASPETQTLTQVSDNKGTYIWVDYIDYASFNPNTNTVRLRYKFWNYDNSKTSADAELSVSHSTGTGAVTNTNLTGASYSGTDTQDGANGWYYVDVPLAAQGSSIMRSVVRVSGTATNSANKTVTLYRDVTFTVMPTQDMTVSMSHISSDAFGLTTTATITLPNGLGYALFPLVVRIEAYNGSINPSDSDLPVGHGTSTFSTLGSGSTYYRTSNSYWFEKTISYSEYSAGTRDFTANFKTIYSSGNPTVVAFSDPDGHFNTVMADLAVGS